MSLPIVDLAMVGDHSGFEDAYDGATRAGLGSWHDLDQEPTFEGFEDEGPVMCGQG